MFRKSRWLGLVGILAALGLRAHFATAVDPGTVTAFAGSKESGYQGDGGPAGSAALNDPRTVAVARDGSVYIADTGNNVIRKVDPDGVITTVAGTGQAGFGGDGGPATSAQMKWPHSVAVDGDGNVYIADSPNHRVRRVDRAGRINTVAGTGQPGESGDGGPAVAARLSDPKGVATDASGRLYIADTGNNRVRRVDSSGTITTVAGSGAVGGGGDDGPATAAQVTHPRSISLDRAGNLFISEDTEGDISRIRKVAPDGIITRLAGNGQPGFRGDGGPAADALLDRPRGIAADEAGNLFIADSENQRIRRVDAKTGKIDTIGGTGAQGTSGDGGPASKARFNVPRGLAVGPDGSLYVADTFGNRVRRIWSATGPQTGSSQPATPPPDAAPEPGGPDPVSPKGASNPGRSGYWILGAEGAVSPFGAAGHFGEGSPGEAEAVDLEPTRSGHGYWIVDDWGGVSPFGDAFDLGGPEPAELVPGERVTSLSATPSGRGYWLFTTRGRVLPRGDAGFFGDVSSRALNGSVLDSVSTPSGRGYYMVASDGGIFAFGDARFAGSMGGSPLNAPVRALVPDGDGGGYWLVASDGGTFAFDAPFRGSLGAVHLNQPVVGMAAYGDGYLMVAADGGIFNFSDRPFFGSLADQPSAQAVVAVAALPAEEADR